MSLSYYCAGDVHAPVLVLLHGFLGRANDWDSLLAALKDDYCLIAVDLPGHGSSQWLEEDTQGADYFCYRLEQTVQTIEQVEGISLKRFNLLGYSLGGRLAMAYTTAFPSEWRSCYWKERIPGWSVSRKEASVIGQICNGPDALLKNQWLMCFWTGINSRFFLTWMIARLAL